MSDATQAKQSTLPPKSILRRWFSAFKTFLQRRFKPRATQAVKEHQTVSTASVAKEDKPQQPQDNTTKPSSSNFHTATPFIALKRDLPLFCVIASLLGLAMGLWLNQANLVTDEHILSRYLQQPFIQMQLGLIMAGLAYGILVLSFSTYRLNGLIDHIKNLAKHGTCSDAIKLAAAEIDNQALPLSYITWVLPVSGFIGTVMGVSAALKPLGQLLGANGIDQGAISAVLSGLNVAFDTTFVGLIGVLPTMALLMLLDLNANRKVARLWALEN